MSGGRGLEFLLLGPVEVRRAGVPVSLGGRMQRALLADLALNAGRVVSTAQLISDLWGDQAPASAEHTVQTYVSRLRRVLGGGTTDVLVTRPPGYLLDAASDVQRFGQLVEAASDKADRGDADASTRLLREALSLWRGAPLSDLGDVPFATVAAQGLDALRLTALEKRIDGDLALGRHRDIVAELEHLIEAYPYNEAFYAGLMRAQYRSGRQADALATFRKAQQRLREDLGIEPAPELVTLHRLVLNQDHALDPQPPRPAAADPAPQPGPAAGDSTPSGRRRRRRWVITVAAVATITAASVVTLVGLGGANGGRVPATGIGVLTRSGAAIDTGFATPTAPTQLAYGAHSSWLTSADGNVVYRLDPGTKRVTQQIPVGVDPEGIVFAGGDVWVTNVLDGTLSRISPQTNRVVQTIGLGSAPTGLAFGYGKLWVTDPVADTLTAVDVRDGRVVDTFDLPQSPRGVAVAAGFVWVTNPMANSVSLVDPSSGELAQRITTGAEPVAITYAQGSIWVANRSDSTVSRLDPQAETVDRTITVGDGPIAIAGGPAEVWVISADGSVQRLDPTDGHIVSSAHVGNRPTSAAVVADRLWVGITPAPTADHHGGTLRVVGSTPFGTIDPALSYPDLPPPQFTDLVYDPLVTYNRMSGSAGRELVPDLALAIPAPTDQGRTFTFELRRIRYSTGALVQPADVRYGIERVMALNPAARSFFPDLDGASACRPASCDLSASITTDERARTLTFHLARPDANFLYKLAFPFMAPAPLSTPESDVGTSPVPGTGPYRISSYEPGREIALTRNPHFREWSAAARPDGYPDALTFTFGGSVAHEFAAIASGRADWTYDLPSDVSAIESRYPALVHVNPVPGVAFVAFNVTTPPFDDIRVRRAVSFAAERDRVVQALGGTDAAEPTCQIIPPNVPGFHRFCPFTAERGRGTWIGPELAKARHLIASSHSRGAHVTVWTHRFNLPLARYVAELLDRLGYPTHIHVATDAEFARYANDSRQHVQAVAGDWVSDFPSASDTFDLFLRCSASTPGQPKRTRSSVFYCRPRIDRLMDRADSLQVTDPAAASDVWARVDRVVTNDAPWVPLVSLKFADVVSARCGHYVYNPALGVLLDQLWVR